MHRLFFLTLLCPFLALAQNGDRKGHENMADIVPKDLIPEAPVLSPEEALAAFTIAEGFTIEPVAVEPWVEKPVALTFDLEGRMWVVEMLGYMADIDGATEDEPQGRIVVLEDTTGDGKVDKRTVFLDKLLLPRTVALVPGGVLVADQEQLYHIGRDGVTAKGELQVVDKHFSQGGNVEHKPNSLMPALDNWLYNAKCAYRYQWRDGELVREPTPFRGQWGITQDNWGRLFFNSNSTLLIGDRSMPNLITGNDLIKLKTSLSRRVGSNRVYPGRVTPGVNRAYISTHNGYDSNTIDPTTFKLINATGACGPVIYRGSQFPESYQGVGFVTESAAQLVKAIRPLRQADRLTGEHVFEDKEFLTSTDERFRPVNLYNAPDGSLYLVDYYHGIIQHKTYMTSYLRRQTLDRGLESPGLGLGRIYRIKATDRPLAQPVNLAASTTTELVTQLASKEGVTRDLAQKTLVEQRHSETTKLVRASLQTQVPDVTKAHLIWVLEGIGQLRSEDLRPLLSSKNIDLVNSALYAARSLPEADKKILTSQILALPAKLDTAATAARFLAEIPTTEAQEGLVNLLTKVGTGKDGSLVRAATLAGLRHTAELFTRTNDGRFKNKTLNKHLATTMKGATKKIDPATLLKGEHLASYHRGQALYQGRAACIGCHGADGAGLPNLGPTLDNSDWVTGSQDDLGKVLLYGLQGPIKINGKTFTPQAFMPGLAQNPTISDQDLADIMTYLRHGWSNRASQVTTAQVTSLRESTKDLAGTMMKAADFPEKQ